MRAFVVVLCLGFVLVAPALADDPPTLAVSDVPPAVEAMADPGASGTAEGDAEPLAPPPAPPAPEVIADGDVKLEGDIPPLWGHEEAPLQQPPPAPVVIVEDATPPTLPPCTVEYRGLPCYQRRDPCGWALDCCGRRYGRFEVVLEARFGCFPQPDGLLGEPAWGAAAPQFDWEDVECSGTWGGRGALRYEVSPQQWVELKGTYYGSWDDESSRVGVFGFRPGLGGPGDPVTSPPLNGTLSNEALAYGAELNFQSEVACKGRVRLDVLVGLRYFRFEEDARADFATAPIPQVPGPAFVASSTVSQFAGVQVGSVVHWDLSRSFELLAGLKVFGGWANRDAEVSDQSIFAGGLHAASDDEDALEWGGELELGLRWRLLRHVSLTASYNLFAIDGMLRASDAMDFSQSTSGAVQAALREDELIFNSFFLGLAFDF